MRRNTVRGARIAALLLLIGVTGAARLRRPRPPKPAKTLRVVFSIAETSFDPQFASDAASDGVISNIYEAMLDYDYLARPVKLVPRTLEAMPTVQDGGKTYIVPASRKGIFFTPDPAFKGKPRELTAADQAYGLKRLLDPGGEEPVAVAASTARSSAATKRGRRPTKTGKFDYDAPMPGLEVVDRYTLRIRLKEPDLRFLYALAVPNTAAVAREVVEAYGLDFGAHPVGTGPYMLGEYKRSSKIVLVANPGYRETHVHARGSDPARVASRSPPRSRASGCRFRSASRSASSRRARRSGSRSSTAKSTSSSGCRPTSSTRRSSTAS